MSGRIRMTTVPPLDRLEVQPVRGIGDDFGRRDDARCGGRPRRRRGRDQARRRNGSTNKASLNSTSPNTSRRMQQRR